MDLRLRTTQTATMQMTASLRRTLHLLQVSHVELRQEISHMLSSHALLEEFEEALQEVCRHDANHVNKNTNTAWNADDHAQPQTLHDHLRQQLTLSSLNQKSRLIAEVLIDGINERGYLDISLEEALYVLDDPHIVMSEVIEILKKLQSFEPIGVAARTSQECLLLQVRRAHINRNVAHDLCYILEECYNELVSNNKTLLLAKTGFTEKRLSTSITQIRSFHLAPGNVFDYTADMYISIPDLIVEQNKTKNEWHVQLHPYTSPKIIINQFYAHTVLSTSSKQHIMQWRKQINEARSFIWSLNNRYSTLLMVMRAIVVRQHAFLEKGETYMRTLSIRDIATDVGLHASTISRVVRDKYVQTPHGIIAMRSFFSVGIIHQYQEISSKALCGHIRQMISSEPQTYPLSDELLRKKLEKRNIFVARRTVSKYRKNLGFASSRYRKQKAKWHDDRISELR